MEKIKFLLFSTVLAFMAFFGFQTAQAAGYFDSAECSAKGGTCIDATTTCNGTINSMVVCGTGERDERCCVPQPVVNPTACTQDGVTCYMTGGAPGICRSGQCVSTGDGGGGAGNPYGGSPYGGAPTGDAWNSGLQQAGMVSGLPSTPSESLLMNLLMWLLRIFIILAFISFVVSGIMFLLAGVDKGMADKARHGITFSILALLITLSSYIIITLISSLLRGGSLF